MSYLGVLDQETMELMNTPRCGNRDDVGETAHRRRKRYALQGMFKRNSASTKLSLN